MLISDYSRSIACPTKYSLEGRWRRATIKINHLVQQKLNNDRKELLSSSKRDGAMYVFVYILMNQSKGQGRVAYLHQTYLFATISRSDDGRRSGKVQGCLGCVGRVNDNSEEHFLAVLYLPGRLEAVWQDFVQDEAKRGVGQVSHLCCIGILLCCRVENRMEEILDPIL